MISNVIIIQILNVSFELILTINFEVKIIFPNKFLFNSGSVWHVVNFFKVIFDSF